MAEMVERIYEMGSPFPVGYIPEPMDEVEYSNHPLPKWILRGWSDAQSAYASWLW